MAEQKYETGYAAIVDASEPIAGVGRDFDTVFNNALAAYPGQPGQRPPFVVVPLSAAPDQP